MRNVMFLFTLLMLVSTTCFADDHFDDLAKTLTSADDTSQEFKDALKEFEGLSESDKGKVAEEMVKEMTTKSSQLLSFVLLLNKANKNPIGKKLGDPIEKAFSGLVTAMRDPITKGGKDALRAQLVKLGIDAAQAQIQVLKIEKEVKKQRKQEQQRQQLEKDFKAAVENGTLGYNHSDNKLAFGDLIVASLGMDAPISDPLLGATLSLSDYSFDFFDPEGDAVFIAQDGVGKFSLSSDGQEFLTANIPYLYLNDGQFFGTLFDPLISGAKTGSPLDGGLTAPTSFFTDNVINSLEANPFSQGISISIFTDLDLEDETMLFTKSGIVNIDELALFTTNTTTVSEPTTFGLLLFALTSLFGFSALSRYKGG